MIATNVHGKNHHKVGSLSNYIINLKVLDNKNRLVTCSKKNEQSQFLIIQLEEWA